MRSRRRTVLCTLCLLVALGAAGVLTAQTPTKLDSPALRLHIVRESGRVNAASVLIRQEVHERDVVMYFLTAGHAFKNEYGDPLPAARSVAVEIGGGRTLDVLPRDIHLPRGNMVDVAS